MKELYDLGDRPPLGEAHQLMLENRHPAGNMAVLVNATETGQGGEGFLRGHS